MHATTFTPALVNVRRSVGRASRREPVSSRSRLTTVRAAGPIQLPGRHHDAEDESSSSSVGHNNAVKRVFPPGLDPSRYTLEQLAFISRKEQGILPTGHDCACCDGVGTIVCTVCRGTGANARSLDDKFNDEVRLSSNAMDERVFRMMMEEAGPCWICKGARHIACTLCVGTGKRDFAENFICD